MLIAESTVSKWSKIIVVFSVFCVIITFAAFFATRSKHESSSSSTESTDCPSSLSGADCKTSDPYRLNGEVHLANIRMLTKQGENAEAYFSLNENFLSYQFHDPSYNDTCDQIFLMKPDGSGKIRVSNGLGATTCAYMPNDDTVIYASTYKQLNGICPPPPDKTEGYVWKLYDEYDIYSQTLSTGQIVPLTTTPGYDAEATISPLGDKIVFTSLRTGDPEIYTMNLDGTEVKQLTNKVGYDGGPFFSWDGKKIVFRASRPETAKELEDYEVLVQKKLVRPTTLELHVMNADGSDMKMITHFGKASFAPFYHPDNKRIAFCSNVNSTSGRDFDIYMVHEDGSGLEKITMFPDFDGFPMWSKDGKKLVFASNRFNAKKGDTNVFIADWID